MSQHPGNKYPTQLPPRRNDPRLHHQQQQQQQWQQGAWPPPQQQQGPWAAQHPHYQGPWAQPPPLQSPWQYGPPYQQQQPPPGVWMPAYPYRSGQSPPPPPRQQQQQNGNERWERRCARECLPMKCCAPLRIVWCLFIGFFRGIFSFFGSWIAIAAYVIMMLLAAASYYLEVYSAPGKLAASAGGKTYAELGLIGACAVFVLCTVGFFGMSFCCGSCAACFRWLTGCCRLCGCGKCLDICADAYKDGIARDANSDGADGNGHPDNSMLYRHGDADDSDDTPNPTVDNIANVHSHRHGHGIR